MAFMRPEIVSGADLISLGIPPEEMGIKPEAGKWYGRLAAPGYIDATEWCEYESPEEALEDICRMFCICSSCHKDEEFCACD